MKRWMTLLLALSMVDVVAAQDAAPLPAVPAETGAAGEETPEVASEPQTETAEVEASIAPEASVQVETAPAQEIVEAAPAEAEYAMEEELEMSAAELEALGFSTEEEAPSVDMDLRLYGFADFTGMMGLTPKESNWYGNFLPKHPAFALGNLNLYLSKDLSEDVRAMSEIRFMYLPNGTTDDYNEFNQTIRYGGIEIQRAYLEWAIHRYVSVRVGHFLTDYGVWNVDHGTPTIIPVAKPFVINTGFFPEFQTGLEFFGRIDLGVDNAVGYDLSVSNGKGPMSSYADWDNNKAVGARLYWVNRALGTLKVGLSSYYGKNTDAKLEPSFSTGVLTFDEKLSSQSVSLAIGADLQWKIDSLVLQAEFVSEQLRTTSRGSALSTDSFSGATNFPPHEVFSWGGYLLAGYRFDFLGVMPYGMLQYFDWLSPTGLYTKAIATVVGLNIRPIDAVVLKVEYYRGDFPDGHFLSDDPIQMLQGQVAWAF